MTKNNDSSFSWMVQQCVRSHHHRRHKPKPGPIEHLVIDMLADHGPLSCPQIARILEWDAPEHYQMVRNAIYRLVEKTMIYRVKVGDGRLGSRLVVWGVRKQ